MRPRRNCLVEGPSSTPHFILVVLPFTLVASSFAVGGNRTAAFAHCSSALVVHLDSNAEISRSFRLPVDQSWWADGLPPCVFYNLISYKL